MIGTYMRALICSLGIKLGGRYLKWAKDHDSNQRPMMLDLMWINGTTSEKIAVG